MADSIQNHIKIIEFNRDTNKDISIDNGFDPFIIIICWDEIISDPRSVVRNKINGIWSATCEMASQDKHVKPFFTDLLNNSYTLLVKEEQWQKYKAETIVLIAKINLIENVFMADIITHMKNML